MDQRHLSASLDDSHLDHPPPTPLSVLRSDPHLPVRQSKTWAYQAYRGTPSPLSLPRSSLEMRHHSHWEILAPGHDPSSWCMQNAFSYGRPRAQTFSRWFRMVRARASSSVSFQSSTLAPQCNSTGSCAVAGWRARSWWRCRGGWVPGTLLLESTSSHGGRSGSWGRHPSLLFRLRSRMSSFWRCLDCVHPSRGSRLEFRDRALFGERWPHGSSRWPLCFPNRPSALTRQVGSFRCQGWGFVIRSPEFPRRWSSRWGSHCLATHSASTNQSSARSRIARRNDLASTTYRGNLRCWDYMVSFYIRAKRQ